MADTSIPLKMTFKELLDSAAGSNPSKAKRLLSNGTIRLRIRRTIENEWNQNQLRNLLKDIRSTSVKSNLESFFLNFIDNVNNSTDYDSSKDPLLRGAFKDQQQDSILRLLQQIRAELLLDGGMPNEAAGVTANIFLSNAEVFIITLTRQDVSSLDQETLETLDSAGVNFSEGLTNVSNGMFISGDYEGLKGRLKNNKMPVYTGVDMQMIILTPHAILNAVTMKTISYSMHAGLIPIGTLGRDIPKGFAKHDRTIAGSIIATVAISDPLMPLQPVNYTSDNTYSSATSDVWRTYLLPDQLPLFDILLLFSNEYGFTSAMNIFGVKITDMGQVISMNDSEIEVTFTYMALDMDIMRDTSSFTERNPETGQVEMIRVDPFENNEYLAKRERILNGISEHRSEYEVPLLYSALDRRSREIQFNRLQDRGADLTDVIKFKKELGQLD